MHLGIRVSNTVHSFFRCFLNQSIRRVTQFAKREVIISYAHVNDDPRTGSIVDMLESRLTAEDFQVIIDRAVLKNGDSIRTFMRRFGTGKHVVALVSNRYLRSPNCMYELYAIWENSNSQADEFS